MKAFWSFCFAALVAAIGGASARGLPIRQCRHECRNAVQQCMDYGMHRRRCQRSYWHACRRVGTGACFGTTLTSTTTTLPTGVTTTTLPSTAQGSVHLTIAQGSRFDHDSMFCAFQVAVTGDGNAPISTDPRNFYVVSATGVRYDALPGPGFMMGMMYQHYCSAADVVPPDGTVICSIQFTMPLWMSNGDLWFEAGGYQDHVPFTFWHY